jgi:hypothetical protein
MSKNKATILLIFQAAIFGLAQIWGIRFAIKQWIATGLVPILNFSDSSLYLSQLKSGIETQTNFPLWFIYEHRNSGASPAGNEIYLFWGQICKQFGFGIFETYLLMTFLTGLITFISINSLLEVLEIKPQVRLLFTPFIAISGIGFGLGRPSPTQLTLWILIFGLTKSFEKERKYLWLNFFGILLILTNPMYAIFYLSLLFLRFMVDRDFSLVAFCKLSPLLISTGIFVINEGKLSEQAVMARFGLVATHLPGAVRPTLQLILVLSIIFFISRIRRIQILKDLPLLITALLIALNSQLVTGKVFEMESHFRYTVNLILCLSVLVCLKEVFPQEITKGLFSLTLILAICISLVVNSPSAINARVYTKGEIHLLKDLQASKYKDKVFLIKQSQIERDLYMTLPLNTDIKLYWHPDIPFYNLSDYEILERFGCTIDTKYNIGDFHNDKALLYGHKYENLKQLDEKSRYFPLLAGPNIEILESNQIILDFQRLKRISRSCKQGEHKYKKDFDLLVTGILKNISKK